MEVAPARAPVRKRPPQTPPKISPAENPVAPAPAQIRSSTRPAPPPIEKRIASKPKLPAELEPSQPAQQPRISTVHPKPQIALKAATPTIPEQTLPQSLQPKTRARPEQQITVTLRSDHAIEHADDATVGATNAEPFVRSATESSSTRHNETTETRVRPTDTAEEKVSHRRDIDRDAAEGRTIAGPVFTRARAREASGPRLQIGTIDVHIAPPPIANPPSKVGRSTLTQSASALSRGFTSPFGLRQE